MLQNLIIQFSLYYLSCLREVKNNRKFKSFSSKRGRGRLREAGTYKRFQIYFGKMVAGERWSLTRGGRNRRFDYISIAIAPQGFPIQLQLSNEKTK